MLGVMTCAGCVDITGLICKQTKITFHLVVCVTEPSVMRWPGDLWRERGGTVRLRAALVTNLASQQDTVTAKFPTTLCNELELLGAPRPSS